MSKPVTIVTGSGEGLGTGHSQRMLALAHHLRGMGINVRVHSNTPLESAFSEFHSEEMRPSALIIRDMRDSSQEEIHKLREFGLVAVIDDLGSGRVSADIAIDLLPNLEYHFDFSSFIYGYNFSQALEKMPAFIPKDIDVLCYLGASPDSMIRELIVQALDRNVKYVFIDGHGKFSGNVPVAESPSFAELMCRSRFVLTYFGITMFEALLCGCEVITVNPGEYHLALSKSVEERFSLRSSYIYDDFNSRSMDEILSQISSVDGRLSVDRDSILSIVKKSINKFILDLERGGFTWS